MFGYIGEETEVKELEYGDEEKIVEIAVQVFMKDRYFQEQILDSRRRRKELAGIYREGISLCRQNGGGILGIYKNKEAAGFLMYFDYKKFRRQNLEDFKKVFGISIGYNKVSPSSFREIHRGALRLKEDPVYVLAIGVAKEFQHQGLGRVLFAAFLEKFAGRPVMSDVSGPFFLRLCRRYGFMVRPISPTCYLAVRENA